MSVKTPLWKQLGISKERFNLVKKTRIDKKKQLQKALDQANKERENSQWAWENCLKDRHDGMVDYQDGEFIYFNMEGFSFV